MNDSNAISTSPLASPVDEFCPRQIVFLIPGNPPVQVTATENGGDIDFTIDVKEGATTADLRALFFHFTEAKLAGLTFTETGGTHYLTETRVQANSIIDLGDNANLSGGGRKPFDIGMEWGTPGQAKDDIYQPVTFTLSRSQHDLTLDDIGGKQFGATLGSVGGPGGPRTGVSKITGTAPWAPDAKDDTVDMFEDGAAGLNSPSKLPQAISLNVLANDTDGDGDTLKITDLHDLPAHGTATIAADGLSILYTPELDWSGSQTLEYCVSDGKGGQDHAFVTINVAPVADLPVLSYTVEQGASITEILVKVTASENDVDSSEFLDRIVATGMPAGVTVTPVVADPFVENDTVTQTFKVTAPAGQDTKFDLNFTATAKETGNGDTETAAKVLTVEIDFTHNEAIKTFESTGQSIWEASADKPIDDDRFLGIQDDGNPDLDLGFASAGANYSYQIGFQSKLQFDAGSIHAEVPFNVTVDSTFNKTTNVLLIGSHSSLANGGFFTTVGPEGSYDLSLIFKVFFDPYLHIAGVGVPLPPPDPLNLDFIVPILHVDTGDSTTIELFPDPLPHVADLTIAFPQINATSGAYDPAGGIIPGGGVSNDIVNLNVDLVDVVFAFFGLPNALDLGVVDLLSLSIIGGINVGQTFDLAALGLKADLKFENGVVQAFDFGTDFMLNNASSYDANHDGVIQFELELTPDATLHNRTDLLFHVGGQLDLLEFGDPINDTLVSEHVEFGQASVNVYDETFNLAFNSESFLFAA
jgi:hypothetical protein